MPKDTLFALSEAPARIELEDGLLNNAFACDRTAVASALVYRNEHRLPVSGQSEFR